MNEKKFIKNKKSSFYKTLGLEEKDHAKEYQSRHAKLVLPTLKSNFMNQHIVPRHNNDNNNVDIVEKPIHSKILNQNTTPQSILTTKQTKINNDRAIVDKNPIVTKATILSTNK